MMMMMMMIIIIMMMIITIIIVIIMKFYYLGASDDKWWRWGIQPSRKTVHRGYGDKSELLTADSAGRRVRKKDLRTQPVLRLDRRKCQWCRVCRISLSQIHSGQYQDRLPLWAAWLDAEAAEGRSAFYFVRSQRMGFSLRGYSTVLYSTEPIILCYIYCYYVYWKLNGKKCSGLFRTLL